MARQVFFPRLLSLSSPPQSPLPQGAKMITRRGPTHSPGPTFQTTAPPWRDMTARVCNSLAQTGWGYICGGCMVPVTCGPLAIGAMNGNFDTYGYYSSSSYLSQSNQHAVFLSFAYYSVSHMISSQPINHHPQDSDHPQLGYPTPSTTSV